MKTIFRIISIILITYLSPNLLGDDASTPLSTGANRGQLAQKSSPSSSGKGNNETSRTEQKMQGLGQLELVIQNGHTGAINGIQLTEDETKIISYSADNTIKIWDRQEGKLLKTLEGHTTAVNRVRFTKEDKKLISYSDGNTTKYSDGITIKIWDMKSMNLNTTLKGHFFSEDEKKIISYSDNKTVRILDIETGKLIHTLEGHTDYVRGIQLTKDEKKLISYSDYKTNKDMGYRNREINS